VNNELERRWNEAVVAYLSVGTKETTKTLSGQPVSGPRFEPVFAQIRNRIVNYSIAMFRCCS
jgi:hypothetical protein